MMNRLRRCLAAGLASATILAALAFSGTGNAWAQG